MCGPALFGGDFERLEVPLPNKFHTTAAIVRPISQFSSVGSEVNRVRSPVVRVVDPDVAGLVCVVGHRHRDAPCRLARA